MNPYLRLRLENQLTQQELAEKAGVSRFTIMRLEAAAEPKPTPKVAVGLATAYELDVEELMEAAA